MRALRGRAGRSVDDRAFEMLVGVAVTAWTFGQLVFVHSAVGQLPLAREFGLGACCTAVALGCLVAAILGRKFDLEPAGLVGLGVLLFVAIVVWRKLRDPRLLVLVLLIVAARRTDLRRLLRFYVVGAVAALLVVVALAALGFATVKPGSTSGFGFTDAKTVACLIMGIVVATCVVEDGRGTRLPCVALCLACAAVAMLVLRVRSYAVYLVLVAVCVLGRDVLARLASGLMARREFSWLMAALPVALFCLCMDADKLYPIAAFVRGGYESFPERYGFAALCCLAVVYARATLLAGRGRRTVLVWALVCICLLACARDANVAYLEFDGMLLFLSLGVNKGVLGPCEPEASACWRGGE